MGGWLKLHRKLLENPIVSKDGDHLAVWIYLLLNAKFEECEGVFKGEKITLHPGQLITGRQSISEKLRVTESKVQRVLKCFEIEQQIEQQTSNKNRLITILSWDKYQSGEQQNDESTNNKRTTDEQQMNTNKELKNLRTKELKNKVQNIYRTFDHLTLTQNEFDRLKEEGYSKESIDAILDQIENFKGNKKYKSLLLTARNWLKQEQKKKVVEFDDYEIRRRKRLEDTRKLLDEMDERAEEARNDPYDPKPLFAELRRKLRGTGSS